MARIDADLSQEKTQGDFTLVPPGDYDLKIVDSAVTESRSGAYLIAKIEHQIINPPQFRGRKVWDQLNIKGLKRDANEDAVRIGREKLKTIATIGGHKNPNFIRDTEELHGLIVGAKIEVDGEYNRVKSYRKPQNDVSVAHHEDASPEFNDNPEASVSPEVAAQAQVQNQPQQQKFPWQK